MNFFDVDSKANEENLIIYKASAGSGKTYTITQEFINLLSSEDIRFSDILAVTFTKKAALEMKNRIIGEIKQGSNIDNDEKFKAILLDIINNYDNFAVSTIDSFLQKIVNYLYQEGHLHYENSLVLETTPFIDLAIQNTIDQIGLDVDLTKNILHNVEENIRNGKSWNIFDTMKEIFMSYTRQGGYKFSSSSLDIAKENIIKSISDLRSEIKLSTSYILKILKTSELTVEDFSYGRSGVMGFIEKLNEGEIDPMTKRAKVAIGNPENWVSKTHKKRSEIIKIVESEILPEFEKISRLLEKNYGHYASAQILKRYFYMANIVEKISQNLIRIKNEQKITFLDDSLTEIFGLCEKLKIESIQSLFPQKFKSIFIDEFQDLSSIQWIFFKKIILEATRNGNKSILVGDPKQSIYRWRGGDWSIMENKISEEFINSKLIILDTNWRSLENITVFNNTFFKLAPKIVEEKLLCELEDLLDNKLKFELRRKIEETVRVYDNSEQKPKEDSKNQKGYVEIVQIPSIEDQEDNDNSESKKNKWMKICIDRLIKVIEDAQDDGFKLDEIAIIVRNNSEARYIIDSFSQKFKNHFHADRYSYRVTSKIATVLGENECVKFIFSAIQHIVIAQDNILFLEMQYFLDNFFEIKGNDFLKDGLKKLSYRIDYSYTELILKIVHAFNLYDFFSQYIDFLLKIVKEKENKIANFKELIKWWSDYGKYYTLGGGQSVDAINIYTIHQSKGLQFPITIIPFCNWDLDHSSTKAPILWSNFSKNPNYISLPVKYSKDLLNSDFEKDYFLEKIEIHLDNLNLVYVAFTRAIERLYIFIEDNCDEEKYNSVSTLINYSIEKKLDNVEGKTLFFNSLNTFFNIEEKQLAIGEKTKRDAQRHIDAVESKNLKNYVRLDLINCGSLDQFIVPHKKKSEEIKFGNAIHSILEKITTIEDFFEIIKSLDSIVNKSDVDLKILGTIRFMTKNDFFIEYFNKNYVHRIEQSILSKEGEVFRPDRIILNSSRAIVVDFKSGLESSTHIKQIKKYISLISEVENRDVEGFIIYIDNESINIKEINHMYS